MNFCCEKGARQRAGVFRVSSAFLPPPARHPGPINDDACRGRKEGRGRTNAQRRRHESICYAGGRPPPPPSLSLSSLDAALQPQPPLRIMENSHLALTRLCSERARWIFLLFLPHSSLSPMKEKKRQNIGNLWSLSRRQIPRYIRPPPSLLRSCHYWHGRAAGGAAD